jgi:hypothetical protein
VKRINDEDEDQVDLKNDEADDVQSNFVQDGSEYFIIPNLSNILTIITLMFSKKKRMFQFFGLTVISLGFAIWF